MAARFSWKTYLRVNLVTVPVKGYNAVQSGGGEIHFHQLHEPCNSRIRYTKVCPIHGQVPNDEIVSGYEYSKDQYVVVDRDELAELRPDEEKAINLETFVSPDEVDPIYFDGRAYYLVPDGAVARRPYSLLYEAMFRSKRYGVGQALLAGKEELVLVRPLSGFLTVSMLHHAAEMRDLAELKETLDSVPADRKELRLAETLIDASTAEKFDFADFENSHTKALQALIDAKVEGHEVIVPPQSDEPVVINMMDALRKSLAKVKDRPNGKRKRSAKPSVRMAKSHRTVRNTSASHTARKRKTS